VGVDWIKIMRQHRVPHTVNDRRGFVLTSCPWCKDNNDHGAFSLSRDDWFTCWKCGGHQSDEALSLLVRVPLKEARAIIFQFSGRANVLAKLNAVEAPRPKSIEMPGNVELTKAERKYLKGRKFDPDELTYRYRIRGGGIAGKWAYRIVIPFLYEGELVTVQGRDITGRRDPRYLALGKEASVMDPKQVLYNIDTCLADHLVLVEGVTDVWRMGDGVAATAGTAMTSAQLKLIRSRFRSVDLLFDPEPEAQGRARKYATALAALGLVVRITDLEMDCDPGDLPAHLVPGVRHHLGLR
jgi:hypothetical protein